MFSPLNRALIPLLPMESLLEVITPRLMQGLGPFNDYHYQLTDIFLIRAIYCALWSDVAKIYNRLWAPQPDYFTNRVYPATAQELKERWDRQTLYPDNKNETRLRLEEARMSLDTTFEVYFVWDQHRLNYMQAVKWNIAVRAQQAGVVLVERADDEDSEGAEGA